ncbi:hypothetical protein ACWIBQ_06555 [Microbacterium keratanolyticum]
MTHPATLRAKDPHDDHRCYDRRPPRTEEEQELSFRRISALNVCDICELSETLADAQRDFVADNGTSIAEATRAAGYAELFTSFGEGEDGPERFYTKLGFVRTGDFFDEEPEAVLDLDAFLAASRTAGA